VTADVLGRAAGAANALVAEKVALRPRSISLDDGGVTARAYGDDPRRWAAETLALRATPAPARREPPRSPRPRFSRSKLT
jgi:hypothetical protein